MITTPPTTVPDSTNQADAYSLTGANTPLTRDDSLDVLRGVSVVLGLWAIIALGSCLCNRWFI